VMVTMKKAGERAAAAAAEGSETCRVSP